MEEIIGVKMNPEESIWAEDSSFKQVAKKVADHLIKSRKKNNDWQVFWRPYIVQEGCRLDGNLHFDAKVLYPDSTIGDVVYTACNIWMEKDHEIWINIRGCVRVFLDGKCIFSSLEEARKSIEENVNMNIPVKLKADSMHSLVVKTICTEEAFDYYLNLSPPRCPGLWANSYLVMARVLLPIDGMSKEEGIAVSPLYKAASVKAGYETCFEFEKNPVYAYPERKQESDNVDFRKLYQDGNAAFAFTEAEEDGYVTIEAGSPTKLILNQQEWCSLSKGERTNLNLRRNDQLLVKSIRERDDWGFQVVESCGIGLSMLDTERKKDFRFTYCGPFWQNGTEVKLPPEYTENLWKPFPDGRGGLVFWRFQNAFLRAYTGSSFMGQWYYATMLSLYGIKKMGNCLDNGEYADIFLQNERFLAEWFDYAEFDGRTFGAAPFMRLALSEQYLDNIGTMGVNFIEAYRDTGEERFLHMIRILQERIKHKVPRFEDGTYKRMAGKTMWADDFFMSCPFLIRLYVCMNDNDSLKEILCQLRGFIKRLYMQEKQIFSHIYFWDKEVKNEIPWGRGNGWIALAMSEILLLLQEKRQSQLAEIVFQEVRMAFADFCEGIAKLQDETGFWHQILDQPESYQETSCTGMFSIAFYRGVRCGWLPDKYLESAEKGLMAILKHCVDRNGTVYGVCMGSSCSMDDDYYFKLPTIKDDSHGTGIVLMLLCEKIKVEHKQEK